MAVLESKRCECQARWTDLGTEPQKAVEKDLWVVASFTNIQFSQSWTLNQFTYLRRRMQRIQRRRRRTWWWSVGQQAEGSQRDCGWVQKWKKPRELYLGFGIDPWSREVGFLLLNGFQIWIMTAIKRDLNFPRQRSRISQQTVNKSQSISAFDGCFRRDIKIDPSVWN